MSPSPENPVVGSLLREACKPEVLAAAFRASIGSPGLWSLRTPMEWVRSRPERFLLHLAQSMADGSYRPEPARRIDGFSADGRPRSFTVYSVRDRVAQRAVLKVVQPLGEALFLDVSYGYRPGLSVQMAVSRVREWLRQGPQWLLRADIHRCFDSLDRGHALALLRALTADTDLVETVRRWLAAAPGPSSGLPLGMAMSPMLCNLSLHGLDLCLQRHRLRSVRWADDLVVAVPDPASARAAQQLVQAHLARLGLSLNPDKTLIAPCGSGVRFLGQRLPSYPPRAALA